MANHFHPMGFSLLDSRRRSFGLQPISGQDDLDLLSTER